MKAKAQKGTTLKVKQGSTSSGKRNAQKQRVAKVYAPKPNTSNNDAVNECMADYSPSWVVEHPNDEPGYQLELIGRIRQGVAKNEWKALIKKLDATEKEFEAILPTSISSMQKKNVYDSETSERIYQISRLYSLGYEVFDSRELFKQWLDTPSKVFGYKKPFELLDSSLGFTMVENEIIRIQFNVYS